MRQDITTHEKINIIKFTKTHRMQQRLAEIVILNGNKPCTAEFLCVFKWSAEEYSR